MASVLQSMKIDQEKTMRLLVLSDHGFIRSSKSCASTHVGVTITGPHAQIYWKSAK